MKLFKITLVILNLHSVFGYLNNHLCFDKSIHYIAKCYNFNCKLYNNRDFYMSHSGKCLLNNTYIYNDRFVNDNNQHYEDELMDDFIYELIYLFNYKNILILLFVALSSLMCSTLVVSKFHKNMVDNFIEKYNLNKQIYDYDVYFFEYLDEYYQLESNELDEQYVISLKYKYIKQHTPKGEIIMNYNHNNSSFDYYSKKANSLDFNYLDVISRIYVVKYNCKCIAP